jgi:hypothetical protein
VSWGFSSGTYSDESAFRLWAIGRAERAALKAFLGYGELDASSANNENA